MYSTKQKGTQVPSDAQAKERLISHIYEFLVHHGAQKTAKSFLEEIHFDKPFPPNQIGEPPGFLFNWWSVFYDLYSSAPERRGQNPHSEEAKAFHDYNFINGPQNNGQMYMNGLHNSNTSSPLGGMPPNDVPMPGNPSIGPTGFFPNSHMRPSPTQPVNQPSPQMMQNQQFMPPRFAGPRGPPPNVRMPQEFNPSGMPGQPMMPTNMDPNRQDGDFVGWQQGPPPSMQQINPRMAGPPGNPRMPMNQFPPSMRPPNCQPNGQQAQPNGQQQMPINMPGGPPGRQWANNNMNYNSPSPGNHYGPPVSNAGPGTPGPGIMASPGSAPYSPANHRMGTPNTVNTGRGDYLSEDIYDYNQN